MTRFRRGSFLGAPIANAVQTATDRAALRLAQSSRFQTLWENANRRAHAVVTKLLTGGGSRVSTQNGTVAINTAEIFDNVKAKLDAKGINIFDSVQLPASAQEFVLFQSKDLEQVQGLVDLLQTLAWVLPFVAVACFAGAIALSRNRRRTIERGAIGVAAAVAVQLVLLKAGRNLYLDAVTTTKSTPGAAGAVWDQLTSFLRTSAFAAIAVRAGDRVRRLGHRTIIRRRRACAAGGTGRSDARADPPRRPGRSRPSSPAPRTCCAASAPRSAVIVLIVWNHPSALTVLAIAVVFVVYLALIEFIGRSARTEQTADASS